MRLRLLDRVRRRVRRSAQGAEARARADATAGLPRAGGAIGSHRRAGPSRLVFRGRADAIGPPAGVILRDRTLGPVSPLAPPAGRAKPADGAVVPAAGPTAPPGGAVGRDGRGARRQGSPAAYRAGQVAKGPAKDSPAGRMEAGAGRALSRRWGMARAAERPAPGTHKSGRAASQQPGGARQRSAVTTRQVVARDGAAKVPWYEIAHSNRTAAGRRHCGRLEEVVRREWAEDAVPPLESVRAIDRLAELPQLIKEKLAAGLDAIHVGPGGVPDLDDMGRLSGVPLPSGRATWDACAGAYGERKIIVGSRPSPSPDVMCHEIGHALDDIDGSDGKWQSDSAEFRALYDRCLAHVVSDFHQQRGPLGRREFFADSFAAIASHQRPALVDMLGGDTRAALNVMLYFNVRYGI